MPRSWSAASGAMERGSRSWCAVELGIPPGTGMLLTFEDGSPPCTVSQICHHIGTRSGPGVHPIEIELRCARESADGLEATLATGWPRVGNTPANL
jgi:hypothetical protein